MHTFTDPDGHLNHQNQISDNASISSLTIPADWLKTIKWNKENCISLKIVIEHDINNLDKLRNGCDSDMIINQIRLFENKLVRNFCKMIFARRRFENWDEIDDLHNYSLVSNWFDTIGLDDKCKEILSNQYEDVEELLNADEEELKILLIRGFNLNLDEINLDEFDLDTNDESFYIANNIQSESPSLNGIEFCDNNNKFVKQLVDEQFKENIELDLQNYVKEFIKRIIRAQRAMHHCLDALKNSEELSSQNELYWDSWNHWIKKADESRKQLLASAIAAATQKRTKQAPKPLPPLPDLKTTFLKNFRPGIDSRSTGSSPLSPPVPPLSAGNFSHRSTSSSSSSIIQTGNLNIIIDPNHVSFLQRRPTPPATPPISHQKRSFIFSSTSLFSNSSKNSERKFPTTPPPIRRHQTNILGSENFPLTKSKSHEEHLSNRIEPLDMIYNNNNKLLKKYSAFSGKQGKSSNKHNSLDNLPNVPAYQRRRLATEPSDSIGYISPVLTSSNCSSPISPDNHVERQQSGNDNCFPDSIPRSPISQAMSHSIHHRFVSTMKINPIQCNVCDKQVFLGFKCRDCKFYCHRDCQDKAPKSCGLPRQLVDLFKLTYNEDTPSRASSPKNLPQRVKSQINYYNSQTNSHSSSNPSSPAQFNNLSSSSSTTISPAASNFKANNSQFQFPPDINITSSISIDCDSDQNYPNQSSNSTMDDHTLKSISTIHEEEEITSSSSPTVVPIPHKPFIDNDYSSLITSGSSGDSIRTALSGRLDSLDSQASDIDSNDQWPKQNSFTSREWIIPYDELKIEEEIGTGRFGTVFLGKWHGCVAIKRLNIGYNNDHEELRAIETFKQEVASFRKTRHDNLVLFMGACMKLPHLAIVTSFCKGLTLHTHIHVRNDKFSLNRKVMIANQICVGMGYLHSRNIIHKDLKTKNIFYENGKVVITDFGLSSVTKFCASNRHSDKLTVPKGWLCYLAPEIIRILSPYSHENLDLPFSFSTDIFAFGTVWYELLCGVWPFSGQPSEIIIWQVGKGIRQAIINGQASQEVKDFLYTCWAYHPAARSTFDKLADYLQKCFPKKRLQRSPSHPSHLQHTSDQQKFF